MVAAGGTCGRCGRRVVTQDQLCTRRTPASPFCWAEDDARSVEIQPGLRLRPGATLGHPLLRVDDPYSEASGGLSDG